MKSMAKIGAIAAVAILLAIAVAGVILHFRLGSIYLVATMFVASGVVLIVSLMLLQLPIFLWMRSNGRLPPPPSDDDVKR